jgi:hypothetical protein
MATIHLRLITPNHSRSPVMMAKLQSRAKYKIIEQAGKELLK